MNLKIFKELKSLRFEGITKRWLTNIVSVILAVLIVVFIIAVFSIKAYYYNSVESILNSGASTAAVSYFSTNLDSGTSLETSAAKFIDSYSYKDKTTVWIIDNEGNIVASSNGFTDGGFEMPDYTEAMSDKDGISRYVGKDNGDEKIMAVSRVITDSNGANVGAVRVMTSVQEIDRQLFIILLVIFLVLVLIFIAIAASNLFFISSIVIPLKEITEKTKEISGGNLDVRIEKKYDDEIGKLSDSINSMASDIATADKMKNDFISTISHELRTPLTSIKGWGETLLFGLDRERDQVTNKGLQVIVNEAGRLEGFVEELLDFSRLQSGRMTLRLMKTDIFAELDETVFT
ncbi:MAG: HAMP domain-containing protein, partial [Eubacterium sp.]|nr:HAMP domain-containing protein [Eubacterium sp.]